MKGVKPLTQFWGQQMSSSQGEIKGPEDAPGKQGIDEEDLCEGKARNSKRRPTQEPLAERSSDRGPNLKEDAQETCWESDLEEGIPEGWAYGTGRVPDSKWSALLYPKGYGGWPRERTSKVREGSRTSYGVPSKR